MHSIRLRGPWELQLPGREPQRVEMPATWKVIAALSEDQPVHLVRRFGQPTGIEPGDRLQLVIESTCDCRVELNGKLLGRIADSQSSSSFDVTTLLTARNELAIFVESVPSPAAAETGELVPLTDVRLEIS